MKSIILYRKKLVPITSVENDLVGTVYFQYSGGHTIGERFYPRYFWVKRTASYQWYEISNAYNCNMAVKNPLTDICSYVLFRYDLEIIYSNVEEINSFILDVIKATRTTNIYLAVKTFFESFNSYPFSLLSGEEGKISYNVNSLKLSLSNKTTTVESIDEKTSISNLMRYL